jgi:hypothetical protein
MADAYAIIKQAIQTRSSVSAIYSGRYREMTPHVLGSKNGRRQALCYQYAGESTSGPLGPVGSPENWRCVNVEKLSDVRLISGVFHTAPDHTRPQTCVDEIDAVVLY